MKKSLSLLLAILPLIISCHNIDSTIEPYVGYWTTSGNKDDNIYGTQVYSNRLVIMNIVGFSYDDKAISFLFGEAIPKDNHMSVLIHGLIHGSSEIIKLNEPFELPLYTMELRFSGSNTDWGKKRFETHKILSSRFYYSQHASEPVYDTSVQVTGLRQIGGLGEMVRNNMNRIGGYELHLDVTSFILSESIASYLGDISRIEELILP
jgi:hypothetical protein